MLPDQHDGGGAGGGGQDGGERPCPAASDVADFPRDHGSEESNPLTLEEGHSTKGMSEFQLCFRMLLGNARMTAVIGEICFAMPVRMVSNSHPLRRGGPVFPS